MKNKLLVLSLVLSLALVGCGASEIKPTTTAENESTEEVSEEVENTSEDQEEVTEETESENDEYLTIDYYKYYTVGRADKTEENGYYANTKVKFPAVFFVDEYGDYRFAVQSEDGDIEECWFSDNESFLNLDTFEQGDGIEIYGRTLSDCSLYIDYVKPTITTPFTYPE